MPRVDEAEDSLAALIRGCRECSTVRSSPALTRLSNVFDRSQMAGRGSLAYWRAFVLSSTLLRPRATVTIINAATTRLIARRCDLRRRNGAYTSSLSAAGSSPALAYLRTFFFLHNIPLIRLCPPSIRNRLVATARQTGSRTENAVGTALKPHRVPAEAG